jgi:hypothetical protein
LASSSNMPVWHLLSISSRKIICWLCIAAFVWGKAQWKSTWLASRWVWSLVLGKKKKAWMEGRKERRKTVYAFMLLWQNAWHKQLKRRKEFLVVSVHSPWLFWFSALMVRYSLWQPEHGDKATHLMASRKQTGKTGRGQGNIALKDLSPMTYFFQLGSLSTFYHLWIMPS